MDAKAQIVTALQAYRTTHAITGDDLIQVSQPGEETFQDWTEISGMRGDDCDAVVALRMEGYGAFYPTVAAALADLGQYFMAD